VINLSDQVDHPATPSAGLLKLYAKSISGRMLPRVIGPSGVPTPLQPSFFQNQICLISSGYTTSIYHLGGGAGSVGTVSHPVATENYGYMANFVSAATAAATAGTGTAGTPFMRGATAGGANGFFFSIRMAFPDADYDTSGPATGTRKFAGMTSGTMAASVGSDNPAGSCAGFMHVHHEDQQDTSWRFVTKDNVLMSSMDTGVLFLPGKVYDAYIFCAPCAEEISWRIDNVTDGLSAEGTATLNLPLATTLLRGGCQIQTVDAVARNIRMQRLYIESDR